MQCPDVSDSGSFPPMPVKFDTERQSGNLRVTKRSSAAGQQKNPFGLTPRVQVFPPQHASPFGSQATSGEIHGGVGGGAEAQAAAILHAHWLAAAMLHVH
jgi:hypothetical protein